MLQVSASTLFVFFGLLTRENKQKYRDRFLVGVNWEMRISVERILISIMLLKQIEASEARLRELTSEIRGAYPRQLYCTPYGAGLGKAVTKRRFVCMVQDAETPHF